MHYPHSNFLFHSIPSLIVLGSRKPSNAGIYHSLSTFWKVFIWWGRAEGNLTNPLLAYGHIQSQNTQAWSKWDTAEPSSAALWPAQSFKNYTTLWTKSNECCFSPLDQGTSVDFSNISTHPMPPNLLSGAVLFIMVYKRHSWWTCIHSVSWSLGTTMSHRSYSISLFRQISDNR